MNLLENRQPCEWVWPHPPSGLLKKSSKYYFCLRVLCEALCDPLCFNDLKLNTKGTKVSTKGRTKDFFNSPEQESFNHDLSPSPPGEGLG